MKVNDFKQEEMFNRFDRDGSGFIDYNEFKWIWLKLANLREELMARGVSEDGASFEFIQSSR